MDGLAMVCRWHISYGSEQTQKMCIHCDIMTLQLLLYNIINIRTTNLLSTVPVTHSSQYVRRRLDNYIHAVPHQTVSLKLCVENVTTSSHQVVHSPRHISAKITT